MRENILKLQNVLKKHKISAFYIPTSDFHNSEYISEYFKEREYLSGFTGSAGTLLVTSENAYLWTDGRYFIQAEIELKDSGITLFKSGEEGVLTVSEFLLKTLSKGDTLAFDGRLVPFKTVSEWEKLLKGKGVKFLSKNLTDFIWQERPSLPQNPIFLLGEEYSGEATSDKLSKVRKEIKKSGCDSHLLSSLEDIAWLLNLRGKDIAYTPVFLSYCYITENSAYVFLSEKALSHEIKNYLETEGFEILPYEDVFVNLKKLTKGKKVAADFESISYSLYKSISGKAFDVKNPTSFLKIIKNSTEIENLKSCHIKDGVAVTKFMMWLKKNVGKIETTEIKASEYLKTLREENEGFLYESFGTVCAFNGHSAIIHYSATEKTDLLIEPDGILLVDSGGQYFEGTTDVTRTFILGRISDEAKLHYTTVVRSMLSLAIIKFLHGARGSNLDVLSRVPLWQLNLDYKHGTGHGVGYLLTVHEGPNAFRWKTVNGLDTTPVFEEGMVTTDEPGVYFEDKYGIRIENELLCVKDVKNEYGQFMRFEPLTLVPIDLDGIDTSFMTKFEIDALNEYHKTVFEKLNPYFDGEELEKLKYYTREI